MKHCPQCDLEFPDAFRFCGACGRALTNSLRCPGCGELTDEEWPFCTKCGTKLSANGGDRNSTAKTPGASPTPLTRPPRIVTKPSSEEPTAKDRGRVEVTPGGLYSYPDLYDEETTTTTAALSHRRNVVSETRAPTPQVMSTHPATQARSAPMLTILSAYGEPETPQQFRWWHGTIFGFLLLLFVGVLGIGAWYLWSPRRSVTQTSSQPSDSNRGSAAENVSTAPSYEPTSTITPPQATMAHSADEEITRLREMRIVAKLSEGVEIISALEQAEQKYPTDYRFPYELSKLSIKGIVSHHEAFEPLARAAEKAIDNGQSDEMLDSLIADKDGDFYKLSHGHDEWEALEQALRNKDKKLLKASTH